MPTFDLILRAVSHPGLYESRRGKVQAGEVTEIVRNDKDGNPRYGLVPLVKRNFRIIRVVGAQRGRVTRYVESDPDISERLPGRLRRWRINLPLLGLPVPRLLPNIDHPNWANWRERLLLKFPELEGASDTRDTIWDVQLTWAQLVAVSLRKRDEPIDTRNRPVDDLEPDAKIEDWSRD